MGDLVAATVSFTLLVALGGLVLAGATAVPFLTACRMAERRGFDTTRWGGLSLVASLLGLGAAAVVLAHKDPAVLALVGLALTWASPAALWLTESGQVRLGGQPGRHQ